MLTSFLGSLANLISTLIGVIFNILSMLVMLITAVPRAITYVLAVIGYMPPFVGSVIIVSVGIAVTITLVNHWGN